MPSKSAKQHRYMEMIAHGGTPYGGKGPSPAVAKEFVQADKGRSYKALPAKKAKTSNRKGILGK
jgi:hypothetical protein